MAGAGKKKKGNEKPKSDGKKKRKKEKERVAVAEERIKKWARVENVTPGLFELHVHSTFSDGLLSPELVVARAHRNGVRVMALTDHDTMAGIPAALQAAHKHGIRLIPGVEISAKHVTRSHGTRGNNVEESVHILAYYGCCGPSNSTFLEEHLAQIRQGRYRRAQEMVDKLRMLHKPISIEQVLNIAGNGVAPTRPHVARALVEAGHVGTVNEAFTKYLGNDGPAYAIGAELPAAEVVQLIQQTGGISVLAHPWALKDPMPLISQLKTAGLHAMEVYRGSGKSTVFGPVAESFKLVKIGGSDFHATGDPDETDLGGITLPPLAVHEFLKLAEPIWSSALKKILEDFAEGISVKTQNNAEELTKGDICFNKLLLDTQPPDGVSMTLSSWLTDEERNAVIQMAPGLGLQHTLVYVEDQKSVVVSK